MLKLGAGAKKGRDTKLARQIAVKVRPRHLEQFKLGSHYGERVGKTGADVTALFAGRRAVAPGSVSNSRSDLKELTKCCFGADLWVEPEALGDVLQLTYCGVSPIAIANPF